MVTIKSVKATSNVTQRQRQLQKKRDKIEDKFKEKSKLCGKNEHVVAQNPNNKRIQHVMCKGEPTESLCGMWHVHPFRFEGRVDKLTEIETESTIKNSVASCKHCINSL